MAELDRLRERLREVGDLIVAFSGGADSAFLAWVANDTLGPDAASLATVTPVVLSKDDALTFNSADGSVAVAPGATKGAHLLTYKICENADLNNCSPTNGTVTVNVTWRDIQANSDGGSVSRGGGIAIANVLANDVFDGATATLARVTIVTASSTNGVTLDAATGSVSVAPSAAAGPQTLSYHICEKANPANCTGDVSVTVTVTSYIVNAVADSARASSKTGGMAVVNVLANDTLGGAPATVANVKLSLVSLSPSNSQIRLNANGSVDVLGKSSGGTYSLRYQICELADLKNCAQTTLSLNLSGK